MYLDKLVRTASKKRKKAINTDVGYAIRTSVNDISQATRILQGLGNIDQTIRPRVQKVLDLLNEALASLQKRV
jgi:hypothetical protein